METLDLVLSGRSIARYGDGEFKMARTPGVGIKSQNGDPRHGTKDDPRLVLIGVDVHAAEFLEVDKPQPVVLFELVKGWVTGTEPDIGTMHHVSK
jgi:hypothetical protein